MIESFLGTTDCSPLLFNAAKDGNVERIKTVVSCMLEQDIKQALNDPLGIGHTPLIIAARNGHSNCVEYLLSIGADPSIPGTVSFDGDIISRVPPLWAAAAAGHLETCKVLVRNGVDVNLPSSTNSTPLRGACYDGHLEIVRFLVTHGANIETPNRHGHTPLMISCYRSKVEMVKYLILLGVDVNARGVKGNTALHDAAEVGNKEIVEMLLKAGARSQIGEFGVTPLMSAAMLGHTEVMPLLFCLASRKEKQDSWKLLGATLVDRKMDLGSAISCWNNSYMEVICGLKGEKECEEEAEQIFLFDEVKLKVYGGYTEARSKQDVMNLVGDPEAIRMQALIVRERILGEAHPETHYYLRYRGAIYLDHGRWDRTYELWLYILQLEQRYLEPLNIQTSSTIVSFLEAFSSILDDMRLNPARRQLHGRHLGISLEQVVVVLEKTVYEAERYLRMELDDCFVDYDNRDIRQDTENLLGVILQFLHLTNRIHALEHSHEPTCDLVQLAVVLDSPASSPYRSASSSSSLTYSSFAESSKTDSEKGDFSKNFYVLTNNDDFCDNAFLAESEEFRETGNVHLPLTPKCFHLKCLVRRVIGIFNLLEINPLHLACEEQEQYNMKRSPSRFVVEKLIEAGSDPRKVDSQGNTALHVLLTNSINRPSLVKLLLDAGAPLLARNHKSVGGYTCLELIQKFSPTLVQELRIARWLTLKQLAANSVVRQWKGRPELDEILPPELKDYIEVF